MLIEYHCLVKVKASIDQFAEGLGDALDLLRKFPSPLFVANNEVLTASELLQLYNYNTFLSVNYVSLINK